MLNAQREASKPGLVEQAQEPIQAAGETNELSQQPETSSGILPTKRVVLDRNAFTQDDSNISQYQRRGDESISRSLSETVVAAIDSNVDPLGFGQHKRCNITTKQLKQDYPKAKPRKIKKYYSKQNTLIDQFLGSGDEERLAALDLEENGTKIKIAVYGSFLINLGLFVIQLYAAISTGSLSLFATATDAFVSSSNEACRRVTNDIRWI